MLMIPSATLIDRYTPLSPVPGCPGVLAHQAPNVFALWQAWEEESGEVCDVPYWSLVWPAAQVLSQHLFAQPSLVRRKNVLDCGCGGGVVAIAAMLSQAARAVGCDMDQTALAIAYRNAKANSVAIELECRDVTELCDPALFDVILVADLFYQKAFSARLYSALEHAHRQGCEIIIADSGRPFLPKERLVEIQAQLVTTSFDVEGCTSRTVCLYRFS